MASVIKSLGITGITFAVISVIPLLAFILLSDPYGDNNNWDMICRLIKITFVLLSISAVIAAVIIVFVVLGVE